MEDLFSGYLESDETVWQFDAKGVKWDDKYIAGLYRACGIDTSKPDFKKGQKYHKIRILIKFGRIDEPQTRKMALQELTTEIWAEEFGWDVVKEVTELGRRPAEGESYEALLRRISDEHAEKKKDAALTAALSRSSISEKKKTTTEKKKKKNFNPKKKEESVEKKKKSSSKAEKPE